MRNIEELLNQNISRDEMTEEEEMAFIRYWFNKYKETGFCKTFHSPFDLKDEDKPYVGKPFKVMAECDTENMDPEDLPMWYIQFEDGHLMTAYPEEICLLEQKEDTSDTCINTSAGVITTQAYDDGIAKGIHILLNDEIVCALDVIQSDGEARVLVYKNNEDEPCDCITVNR